MKRIFVTGDTHGAHDIGKLSSRQWKTGNELDKKDYLIIAGDFGFIWRNEADAHEKYWMDWFDKKPYTTLVVPGNHENYDRIFATPVTEMFGGKVRVYNDSVIFLERGEIYTIADKIFWIMGGALSIDKDSRVLGQSYWQQELLTHEETEYGIDKLRSVHGEVDYIVTHAAPKLWVNKILGKPSFRDIMLNKYNDPTAKYLEEILKVYLFKYKQWFFGHYHSDATLYDDKARALYFDIVEINDDTYKIDKW
ncbi:MAG: metallophosphoesterase [Mariniphaga sp.]|nr:metallophosphoesterase [Mariniphaga sp.]